MATKCVVLFIFLAVNGAEMGEASHKIADPLLNHWYCQRLVPAFITAAVTPCTYPCLLLSPHEHPRIVVHPEPDGTPCRMTTDLGHHYEVGKCRGSVCRPPLPNITLKRKKRFICLYAFVKYMKAKKQLKELKQAIERLEREAAAASSVGTSPLGGRSAGTADIHPTASIGDTNLGNSGNYFRGLGSSGTLGVPDTSGSPGGRPLIRDFGGNTLSSGTRDRSSLDLLHNAIAGGASPDTGIFGHLGEGRRTIGPSSSGSIFSNAGGTGSGINGLIGNGGGVADGARMSGNNNGVTPISGGGSSAVSPVLLGSGNSGAVGPITSYSSTSASGVALNSNSGLGNVNAVSISTIGSAATGVTSLGGNSPAGPNPSGTPGSNSALGAVRS